MTSNRPAASSMVRVMAPSVVECSHPATPCGMRPRLGFSPTSPQHEDGTRIDPPPSEACATGAIPEATAAAAPPEEPPAVRCRFHGLAVAPYLRSEEHTSELQSRFDLVCRLLL